MEAVQLGDEAPSLARRRLSKAFAPGAVESKRRGSLPSLQQPSILNLSSGACDDEDVDDDATPEPSPAPSSLRPAKRISIFTRQASAMSRVFALSSTSDSFQQKRILPTIVNAMVFLEDPNPDVASLRRTLADRLLDIPRFRCVVKADEKGVVHFEPLARSDVQLEEHIAHVDGKGTFGESDVEELVNDAYLSQWDADMPRWRMKVVTNLKDGRSLIFVAIDHAIGDGVGLISVFLSLFDDANVPQAAGDKMGGKAQKQRKKVEGLSLSHRIVAFLKGIPPGTLHVLVPRPSDPMHPLMIPKDQLEDPGLGKSFAQTRAFPLGEVKSMKNKLRGATVNDVIMAVLAMALRRYLEANGGSEALDAVRRRKGSVRAQFPVNMRGRNHGDGKDDLGNNISFGFFPLPLDYSDPIDCVWRSKTNVDEIKVSPAFALQKRMTDFLLGNAPVVELAKNYLDPINRPSCHVSNVAGPAGAASLDGHRIDDLNFTAAFQTALYFGVLSFGGSLRVSGILDRRASGNLKELMRCFEQSYDDLRGALEGVDERAPLERPDMRPASARALDWAFRTAAVLLPVYFAWRLASQW